MVMAETPQGLIYITSEDANAVANSIKSKSGKKAYVHKKRD